MASKSRSKRSRSRRNLRYTKRKQGGGCGCQNNNNSNLQGMMRGGMGNPYVIPLNDYIKDPSDPSVVISTRIQPNMTGGGITRRNKRRRMKRRYSLKRVRFGGSNQLVQSANQNMVTAFGTAGGAEASASVVAGIKNPLINDSSLDLQKPFI